LDERVSDWHAVLRKSQSGWWQLLKPKPPIKGVLSLVRMALHDYPFLYSVISSHGKHGVGANIHSHHWGSRVLTRYHCSNDIYHLVLVSFRTESWFLWDSNGAVRSMWTNSLECLFPCSSVRSDQLFGKKKGERERERMNEWRGMNQWTHS
jgi:hypothetical protein